MTEAECRQCEEWLRMMSDNSCSKSSYLTTRSESAVRGLVRGLGGLSGDPNPLQEWMLGVEYEDPSDYSNKSFWVWLSLLILSIIWLFASILLCCFQCWPQCRGQDGKCGWVKCCHCCGDRPRVSPIQNVVRWKSMTLKVLYFFPLVLGLLAFSGTAVGYSSRVLQDGPAAECQFWNFNTVWWYGESESNQPKEDDDETNVTTSTWNGAFRLNDVYVVYDEIWEPVEGTYATEMRRIADELLFISQQTMGELEDVLTRFVDDSSTPTSRRYRQSLGWGSDHMAVSQLPVGPRHIEIVDSTNNIAVLAEEYLMAVEIYWNQTFAETDYGSDLDHAWQEIHVSWAAYNDTMMHVDDTIWPFYDYANDFWYYMDGPILAIWVLLLLAASIALVMSCVGVGVGGVQWYHHQVGTEPDMEKMKNAFAATWQMFSCFGFALMAGGALLMFLVQAGAIGCEVVAVDLIENGEYDTYPQFDEYSHVLHHCLSAAGSGDILVALHLEDAYADYLINVKELKASAEEAFQSFYPLLDWISEYTAISDKGWIYHPDHYAVANPLELGSYYEAILGGIQDAGEDVHTDSNWDHAPDVLNFLKDQYNNDPEFNNLESAVFVSEIPAEWTHVPGLVDLERRINQEAKNSGCTGPLDDWCIACKTGSACAGAFFIIDESTDIRIGGSDLGGDGWRLPQEVETVFNCLIDEDKDSEAVLFATGVYWGAQKCRALDGYNADGSPGGAETLFLKSDLNDEYLSHSQFSLHFSQTLDEVAELEKIIRSALEKAEADLSVGLEGLETFWEDYLLSIYDCSALITMAVDFSSKMCWDYFGDLGMIGLSYLVLTLIFLIGWILAYLNWHYWHDRIRYQLKSISIHSEISFGSLVSLDSKENAGEDDDGDNLDNLSTVNDYTLRPDPIAPNFEDFSEADFTGAVVPDILLENRPLIR